MAASRAGAQLRQLLKKECVAVPGAFNGLCGRIVADKGFDAAYVSGAALTASAGVRNLITAYLSGAALTASVGVRNLIAAYLSGTALTASAEVRNLGCIE
jgi:2-methylisocitrate lyase-like PEP mutase family enzyme